MIKVLNPKDAYNILLHGSIQEEKDLNKAENKWIMHSIYVGLAAKRIAKKLGLDENLAEALGYIHDIGRKIDHFNHPIEGYHYMIQLGYHEEAKICLTHSFLDNDITLTAGGGPKNPERYEYIHSFLQQTPSTIYDNIIQLCDLFCLETGFTTIEKRLLDITKRKGIFENSLLHFEKTKELKKRIEDMIGCSLYDLFPEIEKEALEAILKDQEELKQMLKIKTLTKKRKNK